jgi:Tfp pilus assembly protein PilE
MAASKQDVADAEAGLSKAMAALERKYDAKMGTMALVNSVGDASTLLGLDFQAKQYETRRKALLDPAAYARDRADAYNTLKTAVNDKFNNALKEYTSSGLPPEMAKKFALTAASNESAMQQQMFELEYPSGANAIEMNAAAPHLASLGGQNIAAQARRRAPARRRATRRR